MFNASNFHFPNHGLYVICNDFQPVRVYSRSFAAILVFDTNNA